MSTRKSPRKGSLQFWPRKRATKILPSVNWDAITDDSNKLNGFICYKAGMSSAIVKDKTPDSMTKGKKIAIPCTILECPSMKIFCVRFYKSNKVAEDILAENLDKELKRKVKLPKKKSKNIEEVKRGEYDDVTIIVYSQVKKSEIKKSPDLIEIGLSGSVENKIKFVKENWNKELNISDFFNKGQLVDFRGLTKGKGFQGPVKRFGITLRSHKAEKGLRKAGSIGPWHPARVTFRTPMAGQMGMYTRIVYNSKIIDLGKVSEDTKENLRNIKNYGDIKTDYVAVYGSVQGPAKRQLIMTTALRPTKKQIKKDFEVLELK